MKNAATEKQSKSGKARTGGISLDEARARAARGESGTNWAAVAALTDEEIEQAVTSDPDAAPLMRDDFWRSVTMLTDAAMAEKITVTLRLDRDIVDKFKELGPGYQSRMNAVLRAYAAQQR